MRAVSFPAVAVVLTLAACEAGDGGPVHGEWEIVSFAQPGITALFVLRRR